MSGWSWIWWVVGTFGLGGALLLGATLIFGWPVIIGTRIGRALMAVGAGVIAVFAVYLKGRSAGAQGEKDKAARRHERNLNIAREESDAANKRTPDEARSRMKRRRK